MMYPQIQKYCLMSVMSVITTMVVALISHRFWCYICLVSYTKRKPGVLLIPPTEQNIKLYEIV